MPEILTENSAPLIEVSKFITESEALMAAVDPKDHVSPLIGGYPFEPKQVGKPLTEKDITKWETIRGDSYIGCAPHSTEVLIRYPSFIGKAVAKVRRREPMAQLHLTIK